MFALFVVFVVAFSVACIVATMFGDDKALELRLPQRGLKVIYRGKVVYLPALTMKLLWEAFEGRPPKEGGPRGTSNVPLKDVLAALAEGGWRKEWEADGGTMLSPHGYKVFSQGRKAVVVYLDNDGLFLSIRHGVLMFDRNNAMSVMYNPHE